MPGEAYEKSRYFSLGNSLDYGDGNTFRHLRRSFVIPIVIQLPVDLAEQRYD